MAVSYSGCVALPFGLGYVLGNPGPQPLFNPFSAAYAPVVPYWEILQ